MRGCMGNKPQSIAIFSIFGFSLNTRDIIIPESKFKEMAGNVTTERHVITSVYQFNFFEIATCCFDDLYIYTCS